MLPHLALPRLQPILILCLAVAAWSATAARAESAESVLHGLDGGPSGHVDGGAAEWDGDRAALDGSSAEASIGGESSPAPVADIPAFFRVTVNSIDLGDLYVVLRGSDVWMRVTDLGKSGMRVEGGRRERRDGSELVSLGSLGPKVAFKLDEPSLALLVTVDASLFGAVALDLRAKRPDNIIYARNPSLFVNYQVDASGLQARKDTMLAAFAESGLSVHGALLYGSAQYRSNPADSYSRLLGNNRWTRLMTNLTFDWRSKLTRVVVGDAQATSGDVLGGGGILGGVSITKTFTLDPYFVFLPTMQLSGTAMTPSTVEVYVNGQLVRRESLAPGQFDLQNVPLTNGSGETKVVVRDAFGGQQTMVSPYYLALGTLAKGFSDFSYNAGFVRRGYGSDSWNYDDPAVVLRHRLGVTDYLTVGARTEATPDRVSVGTSAAFRLPRGELGAAVAVSGDSDHAGAAALLSYSYVGRPFLFQAGAHYRSNHYANLSLASTDVRQRLNAIATAAMTVDKVATFSLQYEGSVWQQRNWTDRLSFQCNRNLTRWIYAFLNATTILEHRGRSEYQTFAGLSFSLGERTNAALLRDDRWDGARPHQGTTQATVQQSLPVGSGFGYRLTLAQGDAERNDAMVQYQGAYGRVEARYQHDGYSRDQQGQASLTASGGLAFIGGRPYLTRQVQDGFALIRVPGVAGVRGLLSNQVVGTTDRKGDLLIPSLLSYYGNRIGIDDKDVPLDYDIATTELTIAPPYRGGAIVAFPIRQVFSVSGTVVIVKSGKEIIPAYGQIGVKVGDKPAISPMDEAGNFYLENVTPGEYQADVDYADGACRLALKVQPSPTSLVQVGKVRCEQKDKQ